MEKYKNKLVKKDIIYEGLIHSTSLTRTVDHLSQWSLIADTSEFKKSGDKILLMVGEQPTASEIDNLEKFFPSPTGSILRAKIIQHQQIGIADLFKTFLKRCVRAIISKAQRIQQIRDSQKERRNAHLYGKIGNRRCQVCLAATITTLQK